MADIQSNIRVDIDTSGALASIKALQREISAFQTSMARGGAVANAQASQMRQNLINTLNASGQFAASVQKVASTTENFTTSLEKNKMSLGQYFRYAGGASKSFGKFFQSEMDTIEKVAVSRVKSLQTQYIKLGRDANGAMKAIAVRPLALDMENLATKTAIAAQKQQLLNQLLKQGSTNLLNFGKNTQWAGRQLMVGFTIPLGIMGSAAIKAFKEMEEQAIRFKRVYGDTFTTTEETSKMMKQVKDLASEFTKYGVEVQKTMEMAASAAAAGKTGADLLAQVSSATRLAVLGNIDQQKALETTISLTNAFGTSAEELGKKINFLNAVENQTVTSIEDLTTAIPKAAPVIQQLGGNVEDLTFFLTAMREGGINASEGANALKSGLASLINPTTKATKMLSGLGINMQDIVTRNKGNVKNLVVEFGEALNNLDPLKRAQAIEQLFGKFQFSRLSTLFQNVTKEGTQASRVLELTQQTSSELATLANRELRSIQSSPLYKFQKAIADFKQELAPVGEEFMKAITPLINFGTDVLKAFNKLEPGMKQFIVNTTGIVAGLGPVLLMTFGLIANGVANLIKGFAFVKNVFNRASSASTVLGQTTSYMTSEQIKAAAVAASLQQAHNKLTQSFNVETAALNTLIAAYQKVTAAQATYSTGSTTKGKATTRKKYASGVVSVPGPKGAGDIIPAMLAPGEAVIPAKMASKYSGFISSMISGNIPGFEIGKQDSRQKVRAAPKTIIDQVKDLFSRVGWTGQTQEKEAMRKAVFKEADAAGLTGRKRENFLSKYGFGKSGPVDSTHIASSGGDKYFTSKNVIPEHRAMNQVFSDAVEQRISKDLKTSAIGKVLDNPKLLEKMAAQSGLDQKTLVAELKKMDPRRAGGAAYPTTMAGQKALLSFYENTDRKTAGTRIAAQGIRTRVGLKNQKGGFIEGVKAKGSLRLDPKLDAKALLQQQGKIDKSQSKAKTKVVKDNIAATKENTKTTKKDTDVKKRGITEEQRRQKAEKDVAKAKAEIAAGKRKAFTPGQARSQSYLTYGTEKPTKEQRDARKAADKIARDAAKAKGAERRAAINARLEEERRAKKSKVSGRFGGMGAKISGISMAGMMAGSAVGGGAGEIISNVSGIAFTLSSIQSAFAGSKIGGAIATFGTRLLGLASGPIGWVALGLTALGTAVSLATENERKRNESLSNLTDIITVTGDKMKNLGSYFGITPTMPASIEMLQAAGGDNSLANQIDEFKKSETYIKDYSGKAAEMALVTDEEFKSSMLSMAYNLKASGFSDDMLEVIIGAIKVDAKKTNVDIDFKGIKINSSKYLSDSLKGIITGSPSIGKEAAEFEKIMAPYKKYLQDKKDFEEGKSKLMPVTVPNPTPMTGSIFTSEETKQAIQQIDNYLDGLRASYETGSISFKKYQKIFTDGIDQMLSAVGKDTTTQDRFLNNIIGSDESISDEIQNKFAALGPQLLKEKKKLYSLLLAGADPTIIAQIISDFAKAADPATGSSGINYGIRASTALQALIDSMKDNIPAVVDPIVNAFEEIGKAIDNLQTGLDIIALKEDKINDKYDKKIDALDKIQKANDQIAQQQQDQLDLADAITRGDIAGAARAMQQARANAADRALENQRTAIGVAEERELAAVTDPNGRTRKVLEDLIGKKRMKQLLIKFNNPDAEFASGGYITGPGTGTSDDIPAMLSNGEYVIRAKAAKALGLDTLNKMNHAEKFAMGGPVNIAKYAKGGPVNIAKYGKGGYASSDERRASLNKPQKKANPLSWIDENAGWMKWVPGLNMLTTGSAVANAINTKTVNKKDAKRDALYKKGGAQGFEAGIQGMMADMGTNPFMKAFGASISSNPYTDFIMSSFSLPVNIIGSGANAAMKNSLNVAKLLSGKMDLGQFAGSTLSETGKFLADPFVSTFGHLADPNTKFNTGFEQASQTVIDNKLFGADTAEGAARARVVGGFFDVLADPLNYIGVGAAAKVASVGSKVSKFASQTGKAVGRSNKNANLFDAYGKIINSKRSRVSLSMKSDHFMSDLQSGIMSRQNKIQYYEAQPGGGSDIMRRAQVEQDIFGIPANAPGSSRPVYGAVTIPPERSSYLKRIMYSASDKILKSKMSKGTRRDYQLLRSSSANPMGSDFNYYGDMSLILKKAVKDRSTFTIGDSYFGRRDAKNIPLNKKATPSDIENAFLGNINGSAPNASFIEAQIFGGLPYSDISKIMVRSPELAIQLRQEMAKVGLNVPVFGPEDVPKMGLLFEKIAEKSKSGIKGVQEFKRKMFAYTYDMEGNKKYYGSSLPGRLKTGMKIGKQSVKKLSDKLKSFMPAKTSELSPIIRGIFDGNKGIVPGISSIGKRDVDGVPYFLKKLGSKKQQDAMMRAASSADYYPEGAVKTGLQEYFVANTLRKLGINTPDLKIFGDMSSIESGLVLGSRALPEMQSMDAFSHTMSLLRGEQGQADLFMRMMDTGVSNFAQRDAVVNALLGNTDAHYGNIMFNSRTGEMSILDFARLSSAGGISKSAYHIGVDASMNAKRLQSKIEADSHLKKKTIMDLVGRTSIPHTIEEIPFGVPGSNEVLRLGQRSADMKPIAKSLADAFGFDLSLGSLPSDFAKSHPVLRSVIEALETTNIEKGLSAKINAESQQQMLESVFQNIKSVLAAKDATFKYANGGMVGKPKYFAKGGMVGMYAKGGDVVPSMLTPGEFVVSQPAVKDFGVNNLKALNNGTYGGDSMYNYNVNLSVNGSNANADDIARKVMQQIKRIDSQRVGGVRA